MVISFITEEECELELKKLKKESPGEERTAEIAVWRRIKTHVKSGKLITKDGSRIKLWENQISS